MLSGISETRKPEKKSKIFSSHFSVYALETICMGGPKKDETKFYCSRNYLDWQTTCQCRHAPNMLTLASFFYELACEGLQVLVFLHITNSDEYFIAPLSQSRTLIEIPRNGMHHVAMTSPTH